MIGLLLPLRLDSNRLDSRAAAPASLRCRWAMLLHDPVVASRSFFATTHAGAAPSCCTVYVDDDANDLWARFTQGNAMLENNPASGASISNGEGTEQKQWAKPGRRNRARATRGAQGSRRVLGTVASMMSVHRSSINGFRRLMFVCLTD